MKTTRKNLGPSRTRQQPLLHAQDPAKRAFLRPPADQAKRPGLKHRVLSAHELDSEYIPEDRELVKMTNSVWH